MNKIACAAVAAAAVLAAPAPALAAKPAPCGPMAVTDPAGDQQLHVPQVGFPLGQEAAALTDMTGLFLRGDGTKVTAGLVISDLSKAVPDEAAAIRWTLYYTVGEQAYFARVVLWADGEIEYYYGTEGTTLERLGDMKGEFHEGKDGVIAFVIPANGGGKPGSKLTVANVIAAYQFEGGQGSSADFMPDEGEFEATVPACEAGSTPPPGDGGTTPPPGTEPNPQPNPQPSPPSSNPQPAPQADFRVSVKPTTLRAKKLKRGKAIAFTLKSRETVTGVTGTLLKGKKSLGKGKLARLAGTGKLKVKPKGKLKKGRYTLVISGKRPDGSTGTIAVPIRVR